jgi:hypothetical protein
MTEIGESFANAGNPRVTFEFGASGLLRDRLAKGERADVFASANMEHPASLAASGRASPAVMFARNRLCALSRSEVRVTPPNLLERMLDPSIKLGTSTLMTAAAASISGIVGWIGLLIPHLARLLVGTDFSRLLPRRAPVRRNDVTRSRTCYSFVTPCSTCPDGTCSPALRTCRVWSSK